MNNKIWILIGVIILAILGAFVYFLRPQLVPKALLPTDPTKEIRATVVDFGASLKGIDALSPHASTTIMTTFAPYVAPELLSVWVDEPAYSPVRYGTNPIPERIEIQSLEKQKDNSYWVTAFIIEQPKVGDYTNNRVTIILENTNGKWLITDLAGYPVNPRPLTNKGLLKTPKYQIPG